MKRQQQDLLTTEKSWLLGSKATLSVSDKIVPYKIMIEKIWTYGIQVWGCVLEHLESAIQGVSQRSWVCNQQQNAHRPGQAICQI